MLTIHGRLATCPTQVVFDQIPTPCVVLRQKLLLLLLRPCRPVQAQDGQARRTAKKMAKTGRNRPNQPIRMVHDATEGGSADKLGAGQKTAKNGQKRSQQPIRLVNDATKDGSTDKLGSRPKNAHKTPTNGQKRQKNGNQSAWSTMPRKIGQTPSQCSGRKVFGSRAPCGPPPATPKNSKIVSVAESDVGWIVAFRSAKVARIPRYFRGAKGDKGLSATETY